MKKKILILFILLFALSANAADYYISADGSGSTCSKASPCAPDTGVPWTTVDDEESTVYLIGGTYTKKLDVTHNTTDNILYIKPCSASPDPTSCDSRVIFAPDPAGNAIKITGQNVVINGLINSSATTACDAADTTSCNIKITGNGGDGVVMMTANSIGNKVLWTEITGVTTANKYGIDAPGLGTGTEFAYNYIHENEGVSADIFTYAHSSALTWGTISIHDNVFRQSSVNFLSAASGGIDFYNNICDNTNGYYPYDIIHVNGTNISYLRIYNNSFKNDEQMIFLENTENVDGTGRTEHIRIYNNTFSSPTQTTAGKPIFVYKNHRAGVYSDFVIANNVFYKTNWGLVFTTDGSVVEFENMFIENNIFYSVTQTAITGTTPTCANDTTAILDYNIFYKSGGASWKWCHSAGTWETYTELSAFTDDHETFTHNSISQASFTDGDNGDFTLTASDSAAINNGIDLSDYYTVDKAGLTRSGTWDIGSHEYAAEEGESVHTVTVSLTGAGGTLSVTGERPVVATESISITATRYNGWNGAWSGTCPSVSSCTVPNEGETAVCTLTPIADCTAVYTATQIYLFN